MMIVVAASFWLALAPARAQTASNSDIKVDLTFDHQKTHFPLVGAHVKVTCETCHKGGIFKGTPTACMGCHNGTIASGKSNTHPQTSNVCADCHNSIKWTLVHVDHSKIQTNCFSCHNGKTAIGKDRNHIKSANTCENCHGVTTWAVFHFDHNQTREPCEVCHDRVHADGKPFNHVASTNVCSSCHISTSWTIGVFDHAGVTSGCVKCHNGVDATGKSAAHLNTSDQCQNCHTTIAWSPANFDHKDQTVAQFLSGGGSCASCHDGRRAAGRSASHFPTNSLDCALCHTTLAWQPAQWDHQYALDIANCFGCHNGQRPPAQGKINAPKPHIASSNTCTDCHNATNFTTWAGAVFNHVGITTGCISCHDGVTATGKLSGPNHKHLATTNTCESCHIVGAVWTPVSKVDHANVLGTCVSCHDGTQKLSTGQAIMGQLQGPNKQHLPTSNQCDSCHNTTTFIPATHFDHSQMSVSTCFTCHNGTTKISTGPLTTKGPNHISSGNDCETCHSSFTAWTATFNHSGIGTARCDSCHNNTNALGPSGSHLPFTSGTDCVFCHTNFVSFTPATLDHSVVTTVCFTCHNGTTKISTGLLTTKPVPHIQTSLGCENCHVTTTWKTTFDHSLINGATCVSCHDGKIATGQTTLGPHIPASTTCENCHVTTSWTVTLPFHSHADSGITANKCEACHNGTLADGQDSLHILTTTTACASCHVTSGWPAIAATFHNFVAGPCFSCHDGTHKTATKNITGKDLAHLNTSTLCESCHVANNTGWKPAKMPFDHSQSNGNCYTCHSGSISISTGPVKGKITGHVLSSNDCAVCHTSTVNFATYTFSHLDTVVAATPCLTCHFPGTTLANVQSKASAPSPHPATSDICQNCHTTVSFNPAHIDHSDPAVAAQKCSACHDTGKPNAIARPANHPPFNAATQDCKDCHNTTSWVTNAKPDHTNLTSNCYSCHNNVTATGKGATHFGTTNVCEACHNTTAFVPANIFDHTQESPANQACFNCHDGAHSPALGKASFPAHLPTSNTCENCHSGFVSWATTAFSHADPVVAAATCMSCHDGAHAPAVGKITNHLATSNLCANCHTTVQWTLTVKTQFDHSQSQGTCVSCHSGSLSISLGPIVGKDTKHLPTNDLCQNCHNTVAFIPATAFDHTGVAPGSCFTCHNNVNATGKPNTHMATLNTCDDCHTTVVWKPVPEASFKHASTQGACNTCHGGTLTISTGPVTTKSAAHILSSTLCESCHKSTASWQVTSAQVDHTQITNPCVTCHDGTHKMSLSGTLISYKLNNHLATSTLCANCHTTTSWNLTNIAAFDHSQAQGACFSCHSGTLSISLGPIESKDALHLTTTTLCESCHVTTAWYPVAANMFDHSQAIGTCASCHDGVHKLGKSGTLLDSKSATHFITTQACNVCHTTTNWTTLLTYTHISATYVAHYFPTQTSCATCHKQNNEKITFAQPSLVPYCAACHSTSFSPDPHVKFGSTRYTYIELKDCTGACHVYTDATLTVIKTQRPTNPKHRPTSKSWN